MPQYEAWLPAELLFRKGLSGPWTDHLYILQGDDPRWQDRLLFRDYLRKHPEVARAYAKLKRDLAAAFDDDISGYRNAKNAFVAATMAEARAGRGSPTMKPETWDQSLRWLNRPPGRP